jgi:hypothetical protein
MFIAGNSGNAQSFGLIRSRMKKLALKRKKSPRREAGA